MITKTHIMLILKICEYQEEDSKKSIILEMKILSSMNWGVGREFLLVFGIQTVNVKA